MTDEIKVGDIVTGWGRGNQWHRVERIESQDQIRIADIIRVRKSDGVSVVNASGGYMIHHHYVPVQFLTPVRPAWSPS